MPKIMLVHESGKKYGPCTTNNDGVVRLWTTYGDYALNNWCYEVLGFHIEEIEEPIMVTKERLEEAYNAHLRTYQIPRMYQSPSVRAERLWEELKKAAK